MKNYNQFINEKLTKKQMKLPKALRDAIEKKQGNKPKEDDKSKDDKSKEENIDNKGLTDKQKKLPIGLQKAILKKYKNKK
jgi:hypothetical protein